MQLSVEWWEQRPTGEVGEAEERLHSATFLCFGVERRDPQQSVRNEFATFDIVRKLIKRDVRFGGDYTWASFYEVVKQQEIRTLDDLL